MQYSFIFHFCYILVTFKEIVYRSFCLHVTFDNIVNIAKILKLILENRLLETGWDCLSHGGLVVGSHLSKICNEFYYVNQMTAH